MLNLQLGHTVIFAASKPQREKLRKKRKAAQKVNVEKKKAAKKAAQPSGDLVPNPNPQGRKEMVTPEYAEQVKKDMGGGSKKKETIEKPEATKPTSVKEEPKKVAPKEKDEPIKKENRKPEELEKNKKEGEKKLSDFFKQHKSGEPTSKKSLGDALESYIAGFEPNESDPTTHELKQLLKKHRDIEGDDGAGLLKDVHEYLKKQGKGKKEKEVKREKKQGTEYDIRELTDVEEKPSWFDHLIDGLSTFFQEMKN